MVFLVLLLAFCSGVRSSEMKSVENAAVDGHFQTTILQMMTKFAGDLASLTEKFNSMNEEVKALKEESLGSSKSVATNEKSLDAKLAQLQTDLKNSAVDIGILKTKVNYLEEGLKETQTLPDTWPTQLSDLEKNVSKCQASVNSLQYQIAAMPSVQSGVRRKTVRFEAWVGSLDQPVVSNSILKLQDVQQNLGDGYNAQTGVFTAPEPGMYLFWAQVTKTRGPYLAVHLVKGETYIGYSSYGKSRHVTGTVVTAVPVLAGENVFLKIYGAETLHCCNHTTFGGLLLF